MGRWRRCGRGSRPRQVGQRRLQLPEGRRAAALPSGRASACRRARWPGSQRPKSPAIASPRRRTQRVGRVRTRGVAREGRRGSKGANTGKASVCAAISASRGRSTSMPRMKRQIPRGLALEERAQLGPGLRAAGCAQRGRVPGLRFDEASRAGGGDRLADQRAQVHAHRPPVRMRPAPRRTARVACASAW